MSYRKQSIKINRKGNNSKRYEDFHLQTAVDGDFGDEMHYDHWIWVNRWYVSYPNTHNPRNMEEYHICKFTLSLIKMDVNGAKEYHWNRAW